MTIQWEAVEQYFTVMLFVFQFCPVCNFENFVNFGLRSERVKGNNIMFLTTSGDTVRGLWCWSLSV